MISGAATPGTCGSRKSARCCPASEYQIIDVPLEPSALPVAVRNEGRSAADFSDRKLADEGSCRSAAQTAPRSHVRAIVDKHDRIMVLITHNTDFGDSYEREGDNPEYLYADVGARLRLRDQHVALRDDALGVVHTSRFSVPGSCSCSAGDPHGRPRQLRANTEHETSKFEPNLNTNREARTRKCEPTVAPARRVRPGTAVPEIPTTMNCLPLT